MNLKLPIILASREQETPVAASKSTSTYAKKTTGSTIITANTILLNTNHACKKIFNTIVHLDYVNHHQYLNFTLSGGKGSYISFSKRAAVIRFLRIKLSRVIRCSGNLSAWKLTSSNIALNEYGSLMAKSASIFRLMSTVEWFRELIKRLQGRLRSLVAAAIVMIQFCLKFLRLSLRPTQARAKDFSTLGIARLMQFLVLPQKPLANFKYFFLLKPAITNNYLIYQMQEETDPFDPEILTEAISKFDWQDILDSQYGETPKNAYYQFEPPEQYKKQYRLFRAMLQKDQRSERAFAVTTLILKLRPNNYYALMLRKAYLYSIQEVDKTFLKNEISFVNNLLNMNSKQYQLWVYKKELYTKYNTFISEGDQFYTIEKQFLEDLLEIDSKNYHVWDYKLWLTLHFKKQISELVQTQIKLFKGDQVKKVLEEQLKGSQLNVYAIKWENCYSLWSYRFNLAKAMFQNMQQNDKRQFQVKEIERVKQWLSKQQNRSSQCGWNYLTGAAISFATFDKQYHLQIYNFARQIFESNPKNRFVGNSCLQLLQFLEQKYQHVGPQTQKQLVLKLKQIDPVRELYYDYLLDE